MSVEGVSHTNRIYLYRSLYETMVPETSDRYFPANVEFMNNYSDEVNGGYYRLDNIGEELKKAHEDKLRAEGKLPPLEEQPEAAPAEVKPTTEELLEQIRDLLAAQNAKKDA